MQTSDENKEKYQLGDKLRQYQILQIYMIRNIWQTVRRITNEIMGVKGLRYIVFVMKSILLYQTRKSHFDNKTNCRPELIQ